MPNAPCVALFGFTSAPPFPIDLTFLGFTGCNAYIDGVVAFGAIADGAGAATIGIAIPASAGLVGFLFYSQWAALDGLAAGGLTTSNYGRALVGN